MLHMLHTVALQLRQTTMSLNTTCPNPKTQKAKTPMFDPPIFNELDSSRWAWVQVDGLPRKFDRTSAVFNACVQAGQNSLASHTVGSSLPYTANGFKYVVKCTYVPRFDNTNLYTHSHGSTYEFVQVQEANQKKYDESRSTRLLSCIDSFLRLSCLRVMSVVCTRRQSFPGQSYITPN